MKRTTIAVVLLLGVMLGSGLACDGDGGQEPTPTPTPTLNTTPGVQTVTIQPGSADGKDSFFSNEAPGTNQDNSALFAGTTIGGGHIARSYLQLELTNIPSTAVVTEAKLGLYYLSGVEDVIAGDIGIYKVNSSWSEGDVTWNNNPPCASTAEAILTLPANATYRYEYWDISDLVQGWIDGSILNYGVCVKDTNENTREGRKHFVSSDSLDASWRPLLVISYNNPVAP